MGQVPGLAALGIDGLVADDGLRRLAGRAPGRRNRLDPGRPGRLLPGPLVAAAALAAGPLAAVRGALAAQGRIELFGQPAFFSRVSMWSHGSTASPRQGPEIVPVVEARRGEGVLPGPEVELVVPAVEPRAAAPGVDEDRTEPPVAAREDGFEDGGGQRMGLDLDRPEPAKLRPDVRPASPPARPRRPCPATGTACAAWG